LCSGGPRDAPGGQQTLWAALDWSYRLLGEEEQRLYAQLSVFVGGWDLDGAEAIADPDLAVVDTLASLVESSLVRQVEEPMGDTRYAMLETIREYAGEVLAHSGEAEAVRRRHAEYVLILADRAAAYMSGRDFSIPDDPERRLREELPNLRAALEWAVNSPEPALPLRLAIAGAYAWAPTGAWLEGGRWIARALEVADDRESVDASDAIYWQGVFAGLEGDHANAERFSERALELSEMHGDHARI